MIASFFDLIFGCTHKNYTFPITNRTGRRNDAAALTGTYVVCLDCGKEFPYDWKQMKVVSASATPHVLEPAHKPEPAEVVVNLKAA
jgi:hypothetical protein